MAGLLAQLDLTASGADLSAIAGGIGGAFGDLGKLIAGWQSGPPGDFGSALSSLGGLSALHAHWRHPGVFAGLHLASGSFFTPSLDPQESGYSRWSEVTGFVAQVGADGPPARKGAATPAISMVCGTAEENLANNLHMRDVLRGQGFAVSWGTVADTHCYTCWRDLFDPHLTQLLTGLWGEPGSEGR